MLAVSLLAADAKADGGNVQIVEPPTKPSFWKSGPAGGAFGFFVEGGATLGIFAGYPFGAASLGLGVSLRWFEASFTGYYGSSFGSFDGPYSAAGFLGRVALRIPAKYVAFTLGGELGYVAVLSGQPDVFTRGLVFEPLSVGVEIDPVCHLRIGVLGAFGAGYSNWDVGIFRGALTVGYVMGACSKR
jgi:hypothetical protein